MGSWNRRNQQNPTDDKNDYKDLLVFGYQSTIYPNDYQSEHIAEERHMVACLGDAQNRVDRYDCRLLLPSLENALKRSAEPVEQCPTEAMEEDMCDEERYVDLNRQMQKDVERREAQEEENRRREERNAIGFDYGTSTSSKPPKEDSDSEDEPFEAPEGVKFPVGLELPPNMKLHHIIEKTAAFIVANGPQMEIVIKAKQRNNAEQFGFLEFDNKLNPFYKYLQKLIREKKYVPGRAPNSGASGASGSSGASKRPAPSSSSSLAAIAAAHASDSEDSDGSDCELHPSLLGRPASPEKPGTHGPIRKPVEVEEKLPEMHNFRGNLEERNDVYSALFKNLAGVADIGKKKEEKKKEEEAPKPVEEGVETDGRQDDPEYREWFETFYGRPCPWIGPRAMLPPTPDLEPILNSYAEHVAEKGAEFEQSLASREDLKLHFMDPKSPYYSFYHHKIRLHQWRLTQETTLLNSPNPASTVSSPGPQSLLNLSLSTPPEPPLNRRQRRRLLDSSRLDTSITEPGVFDPLSSPLLPKSASTPARLQNLNSTLETPIFTPRRSGFEDSGDPKKPISFSLKGIDEEDAPTSSSFRFDPDLEDYDSTPSTSMLPPPPVPPVIPTASQMTDRKEKARIFMEKLLLEKKIKKQQEDEERMKLEEEARRKAEKISESLEARKSGKWDQPLDSGPKKTLDEIINSRINSLLSESGFQTEDVDKKKKEEEEKEKERKRKEEERERDRDRKRHKKRSRSRRRSRSDDRKKSRKSDRRHRSRSSSRDRRHRRNRSRSRERSYRR